MADLIKLGGLWKNKGKSGVDFLSGKLSPSVNILIFVNKYKQAGDNQPTHIMYLSPVETDAARGGEQNDSFMAGSDSAPADESEDAIDDFTSAPARPQAPRPAAPARTMNAQSTNTRPTGDVRPAQNGVPASQNRRPAPAPQPQADDIGDFEDPFGD